MNKSDYKIQLKNDLWKQKRSEILKRDKNECQMCMSRKELHVHHKKYIEGKKAWEYEDRYLITVCKPCHKKHHIPLRDKKSKLKVAQKDFKYSKNDQRHIYYKNIEQAAKRYGI